MKNHQIMKRERRALGLTSLTFLLSLFYLPTSHSLPVEIQQNIFYAWMQSVDYRTEDPEGWSPLASDAAKRKSFPTIAEFNADPFYASKVWTVVNDGTIEFTNDSNVRVLSPSFPEWGWPNMPVPVDVANDLDLDAMHNESQRGDYRVMTNYWDTKTIVPDQHNDPADLPLETGTLRIEVEDGSGGSNAFAGAFKVLTSPDSFWRYGRPRVPGTSNDTCLPLDEFFSDHTCQWAPFKPLDPFEFIMPGTEGNHAPAAYPSIYNGCHYGQCTEPGPVADPRDTESSRFISDLQGNERDIAGAPYPIRMDMLTSVPSHWITDATRAEIDLCEIPRSGIPRFCNNDEEMHGDAIFNVAYDIWIDRNTPRTSTGMWAQSRQNGDGTGTTDGVTIPWPYSVEEADTSSTSQLLPESPKSMKQNDGLEIMIWVANNGYLSSATGDGEVNPAHPGSVIRPAGTRVAAQVTIEGVSGIWDVWATIEDADGNGGPLSNEFANWYVVSYVRVAEDGGVGFDLKTGVVDFQFDSKWFINHAATLDCGFTGLVTKCLERDWWMTSIQAGFEIWANGEQLESRFFDAKPSTVINVVQGGRFHSKSKYVEVDAERPFLATAACDKPLPGDTGRVIVHHPNDDLEVKDLVPDALGVLTARFENGMRMDSRDEALAYVYYEMNCVGNNARSFEGTWEEFQAGLTERPRLVRRVEVVRPARVFDMARNEVSGAKVKLYYRPDSNTDWIVVPDGDEEYLGESNLNNPSFASQYGGFLWEVKKTGFYKVRGGFGSCHAPGQPSVPYVESETYYREAGATISSGDDLSLECPREMPDGSGTSEQLYCDWYSDGLYPMCETDTGWWGWENNTNCISQSACDSTGNETVTSSGGGNDDSDWLNPNGAVSGPTKIPDGYGPDVIDQNDNEGFMEGPDDVVPDEYSIRVHARGTSGTEKVKLTVGGSTVAEWILSSNFQTRSFVTELSGGINVEYVNDYGNYRDVVVDHVEINGVRHEAEEQTQYSGSASGTGDCATGFNDGWIHCNGYIGFSAFK